MAKRGKAAYMISAVAENFKIHPQTLRLYEREGLLKPSRTEGNTRLYTDGDIERLELILNLTRDMGVNLAGVEVVLNMRAKMEQMRRQMEEFVALVQRELMSRQEANEEIKNALVRLVPCQPAPLNTKQG
jgi:MerR family transcriptional regulator, heat shock protein HspR